MSKSLVDILGSIKVVSSGELREIVEYLTGQLTSEELVVLRTMRALGQEASWSNPRTAQLARLLSDAESELLARELKGGAP